MSDTEINTVLKSSIFFSMILLEGVLKNIEIEAGFIKIEMSNE